MEPIVKMEGITKKFPGVIALNRINFEVLPGEVHVLLGENGAGKSTLMKILSGAYQPDEGTIYLNGSAHSFLTPRLAAEHGITIIYQELSLAGWLNIQENIFMGNLLEKKIGPIKILDKKSMNYKTQSLLEEVNLGDRKPSDYVGDLSISEKQMVEIAKAISQNSNVIVMDEPTSSLSEEEVERLFKIIHQLKSEGKSIVFISHKLSEIKEIGDRITILKDGGYVGTYLVEDLSEDDMIQLMVGRELQSNYQHKAEEKYEFGETIFSCEDLTSKDHRVEGISFTLKKGEILGFSGLVGAGRTEVMETIFGARRKISGKITLNGKILKIEKPYHALKQGIGLVTESRRETGFFGNFNNRKNISIASQLFNSKLDGLWGFTNKRLEEKIGEKQAKDLQIKCSSLEQLTSELSGGNQQKVILGKWLSANSQLLIFDEPTKGIDVGTKSEIYKLLRKLADEGIGILVVSSEMPELLAICDRIIVMAHGRIAAEYPISEATEELLAKAATTEAS